MQLQENSLSDTEDDNYLLWTRHQNIIVYSGQFKNE